MKNRRTLLLIAFAATLISTLPVSAVLVDFANSTDFTTDFTTLGTGLSWNAANGAGGVSGRVNVNQGSSTDGTSLYNVSSFDLSNGAPLSMSIFFQIPNPIGGNSGVTAAQVGFSEDLSQNFLSGSGQDYITARVMSSGTGTTYFVQGTFSNNGTASNVNATSAITLTAGNWYKLSATFTDAGTSFNYSAGVENWGTTGSSLVGAVSGASISGTLAQTSLSNGTDTTAYGGFRANGTANNKVLAIDNFEIVPEPSTGLLLLGGLGLLIGSRRILRKREA